MLDANRAVTNPQLSRTDPHGNMFELESWSPQYAQRIAQAEGIELTEEHWAIVVYLRERYRDKGPPRHAREVLEELEEKFCEGQGRRHLYELFPGGPVTQGSQLAGLPVPPYAIDPSFGSAQ